MNNPSYLSLSSKELESRSERAFSLLSCCNICPRNCRINRIKGERGCCGIGARPTVSSYFPHFGEEKVLTGRHGSGTVFLTGCNLSCVYCQNYEISQMKVGEEFSFEGLAEIMVSLQRKGCCNINFVTPTSQVPAILKSLTFAVKKGLNIPLVYNTNAYDSVETLELLEGIFDIYMPDMKYHGEQEARKYSKISGYPRVAQIAIKEMHRQVGDLKVNREGVAKKGLLVRHLVLPNDLSKTEGVLRFIKEEVSENTFINIMGQYRPFYKAFDHPELSKAITSREHRRYVEFAEQIGLKRVYS